MAVRYIWFISDNECKILDNNLYLNLVIKYIKNGKMKVIVPIENTKPTVALHNNIAGYKLDPIVILIQLLPSRVHER